MPTNQGGKADMIHPPLCRAVSEQWERVSDVHSRLLVIRYGISSFMPSEQSCSWTISIPLVPVLSVPLALRGSHSFQPILSLTLTQHWNQHTYRQSEA